MPKQPLVINQFYGGMNNGSDPRDLKMNEASFSQHVDHSERGRMQGLDIGEQEGSLTGDSSATFPANGHKIEAGQGLVFFSSDYGNGEQGNGTESTGDPAIYAAITDNPDPNYTQNAHIYIYNFTDEVWSTEAQTIGQGGAYGGSQSDSRDLIPRLYFLDGALRVANTNFSPGHVERCESRWYGYINRTLFGDTSNANVSFNQWVEEPQELLHDLMSFMSVETANGAWGDPGDPFFLGDGRLALLTSVWEEEGKMWSGNKKYYYSYIYDEKQESRLYPFGGWDVNGGDSKKRFKVVIRPDENNGLWSPRITGVNIYYRDMNAEQDPYGEAFLLLKSDFTGETKSAASGSGNVGVGWEDITVNTFPCAITEDWIEVVAPPDIITYKVNSSCEEDEKAYFVDYKTSCVLNGKLYVGNVFIKSGDATGVYNDVMIQSPVGSYDVLPWSRRMEISADDGEAIVHLEGFADRILQFKESTLYIVNVSQEMEFVEDVLHYHGVTHGGQVCKTEYGVAWQNKTGLYLYDGQRVTNLLEAEDGTRKLSKDTWRDYSDLGGVNYLATGYIPQSKSLVLLGTHAIRYHIPTKSFTIAGEVSASYPYTNFANFPGAANLCIFNSSYKWLEWDLISRLTGWAWDSPNFDFGDPSRRKNIYSVWITHNSDLQAFTLSYSTDNGTNFTSLPSSTSQTSGYITEEFELKQRNIKTLMLRIVYDSGEGDSGIITDISISYRLKTVQ
jgi:hypothetical protein